MEYAVHLPNLQDMKGHKHFFRNKIRIQVRINGHKRKFANEVTHKLEKDWLSSILLRLEKNKGLFAGIY